MTPKRIFEKISSQPMDSVFGALWEYTKDPNPNKINLTVGTYLDNEQKCPIAPYLKKGEELLIKEQTSKTYLSAEGDTTFIELTKELLFGTGGENIVGLQTVGGTSAIRLLSDYIKREFNCPVYIPNSTWPNHIGLMEAAGLQSICYPYFNSKNRKLLFEEMVDFLSTLLPGSIILLHACCHNPSGLDLSQEEWKRLGELFIKRGLIPFFDTAYQGFGKGLEEDAFAVRYFYSLGLEMFVAYSYSKMFDLYRERVGCLMIVNHSKTNKAMLSSLRAIVRRHYSNPPAHGAETVRLILTHPSLRKEWKEDLEKRRQRIVQMRTLIADKLEEILDVQSIRNSLGFFAFLGFSNEQVYTLRNEGIYMLDNSRINVLGVNEKNIEQIFAAIERVLR